MVTWIPSIYPIYVSIFLPAPWIRHGLYTNKHHLWRGLTSQTAQVASRSHCSLRGKARWNCMSHARAAPVVAQCRKRLAGSERICHAGLAVTHFHCHFLGSLSYATACRSSRISLFSSSSVSFHVGIQRRSVVCCWNRILCLDDISGHTGWCPPSYKLAYKP